MCLSDSSKKQMLRTQVFTVIAWQAVQSCSPGRYSESIVLKSYKMFGLFAWFGQSKGEAEGMGVSA